MKIGYRKPSLKKSLAARMSIKKKVMPRMPKGMGVFRDPEKAVYNKVYNMTTRSVVKDLTTSAKGSTENEANTGKQGGSAFAGFVILAVIIGVLWMIIRWIF